MRQLLIEVRPRVDERRKGTRTFEVPRGQGKAILNLAQKYQGTNLSQLEANTTRGEIDLVIAYLPNAQVEKFLNLASALLGQMSKIKTPYYV